MKTYDSKVFLEFALNKLKEFYSKYNIKMKDVGACIELPDNLSLAH